MRKILLIEDNNEIREELATLLSLEDYKVIEAADGSEGIEVAKQEKPDLILCDILMPGVDGFEVLSTLRNNKDTEKIYFIFLTALSSDEFVKKLSDYDFTGYLRKPFHSDELLETIRKTLL